MLDVCMYDISKILTDTQKSKEEADKMKIAQDKAAASACWAVMPESTNNKAHSAQFRAVGESLRSLPGKAATAGLD